MFDLWSTLASAKQRINIVGVLPLNITTGTALRHLRTVLRDQADVSVTILCESDDEIFRRSLSLDTPVAPVRMNVKELTFRRDLIHELYDDLSAEERKRIAVLNCYSPLTVNVIDVDGHLWCAPVTDVLTDISAYEALPADHAWAPLLQSYTSYLTTGYGTRFTAARRAEVIELYDQSRAPRGLFPRQSFYDTTYHQYVIWDFIFDRSGNLLIHQRADNAKDNRGMWDKSVGGHVDWSRELTSARTAVRELIEELFEDELNKETMAHFTESEGNVVYMGDWRPEKRGRRALEEIRAFRGSEWAYFSLRDQLQLDTPRHFPDAVKELRVIADLYIFIANVNLRIDRLKNSKFRLVRLSELKSDIDRGEYRNADGNTSSFVASPDLRHVMSGPIREILEDASQSIRFVFGD